MAGVGNTVTIEGCEGTTIIVAAHSLTIKNCINCTIHLCCANLPVLEGVNRDIKLAPYNTFYSTLGEHLTRADIPTTIDANMWQYPVDSNNRPIMLEDADSPVSILPPEDFAPFVVPFVTSSSSSARRIAPSPLSQTTATATAPSTSSTVTSTNPFQLPPTYSDALKRKSSAVTSLRTTLAEGADPASKSFLQKAIDAKFQEWLIETGHINQVNDLLSFTWEA
eukprot:TRINITY_DN8653_c0_g1_i3.p1 TRINITY_DN8653_c0_g1~~TRINITY_DN8653_c0_g1_i3.p1  ORF type:complete len:223 (-),score=36.12 TRINITY_DN8653_c0_g1_i3:93-761(-)